MFPAMLVPGDVVVTTTSGRGRTPDEIAERLVAKLVFVSEGAPPAIRDQALAYQNRIRAVCAAYLHDAIKSDRVTLSNRLTEAGHPEAAALIQRI